jgi:glycyl-tRNA synthetase
LDYFHDQAIESLDGDALLQFKAAIEQNGSASISVDGSAVEITQDLVTFTSEKKMVTEAKYVPSVIEPSYGIGRIMYAVLEHAFSQRNGDEQRCVMAFRPLVAPIKVGIYRLINNPQFDPIVARLKTLLQSKNIATRVDSSTTSVGRRYSRSDELGTFSVTCCTQ